MSVILRRVFCIGMLCTLAFTATANAAAPTTDVQLQIDRLWAVTEVQNLLGTYSLWHTSGFNHRVPDLFTHTDDTVIEMMWGRYTGKDAAYRCYFIDHRREDELISNASPRLLDAAPMSCPRAPSALRISA